MKNYINQCENRALNFIFGSYDFKYDYGAFEKNFIALKNTNSLIF